MPCVLLSLWIRVVVVVRLDFVFFPGGSPFCCWSVSRICVHWRVGRRLSLLVYLLSGHGCMTMGFCVGSWDRVNSKKGDSPLTREIFI
jgi:hypothetical protein